MKIWYPNPSDLTKPWLFFDTLSIYKTDPIFMTPPKVIPRFSRANLLISGFIYNISTGENLNMVIDTFKAKLRSGLCVTGKGIFVKSANGLVYYLYLHNEKILLYKVFTRANPHIKYMVDTYGLTFGSSLKTCVDRKRHVIMASLVDPSDSPDWWVEYELSEAFLG